MIFDIVMAGIGINMSFGLSKNHKLIIKRGYKKEDLSIKKINLPLAEGIGVHLRVVKHIKSLCYL